MLFGLLAKTLLAATLFDLFPVDAATIEARAALPMASVRVETDLAQAFSLVTHTLPEAADAVRPPVKTDATSLGVETSAVSAIVIDRASRAVLFEKQADRSRSIGSITKLMTAFVFLSGDPDLSAPASLQAEDIRTGGRIYLPIGETVTVKDLLLASLVGSDNSATAALVRLSGLSEGDFVGRMNEAGAEMGLVATSFRDATGLSADNRSIVPDIAKMLDRVLKEDVIREATEQPSITITGASGRVISIEATDELLTSYLNVDPYKVVGGKTGYLPEAGYCLGTLISEHGSHELLIVVLGSETNQGRFQDVKALAAWTYKVYRWADETETSL